MNQKVRKSVLLIGVCLCGMFTMQAYAAGGGNSPVPAVQQSKKITGTVVDSQGPIIGASVVVKGTSYSECQPGPNPCDFLHRLSDEGSQNRWT